ncbi:hypothetical protein [Paenibacillus elgii]|uniref:hypothetical protein n=1 Tax=Paenibacillus elgii TaxID=189691 RepID=UPI000248C9AB|nr:hypothetical protein [Paenibacillus elgii]
MVDLFKETSSRLGLTEADIYQGTLTTGGQPGPTYLSTKPQVPSAVKAKMVSIHTIEELKDLVGGSAGAAAPRNIPEPWPQNKQEADVKHLNESEERQVYAALRTMLAGQQETVSSYTGIVERRYFPIQAGVFAVNDIVVKPDHPLVIEPEEGHDPVILNVNSITLEPGGQIFCHTPVIIIANKFIKQ